jgi:excisionase family DNA binding protein
MWGFHPMAHRKKNRLSFVRNCPITADMQDTSPPFVLTVTEAAKAVRCRRTVLEEFIRTGELTAFSVGGQRGTRISHRALEAFMQKRALRN